MSRRIALFAAICALAAGLSVQAATASRGMLVGLLDDSQTLYGDPDRSFPILQKLRTQVLRVTLSWGGRFGVARRRPQDATDPADPAYDWSIYDRTVNYAAQYGIKIVFGIQSTPGWANGGRGARFAPTRGADLQSFAYAAATRYSGSYLGDDGRALPAVRLWLAWNEPNNPLGLAEQYRRVGGRWLIQSAIDYARICNAIYKGVHLTLIRNQKVGCGVTSPRGNNSPGSRRSSVSPLAFLRALKEAGVRKFDAYAHHPYYGKRTETPSTRPNARTAVTLGNIDALIAELTRFYGRKRVWITEYGYQTNPPDRALGVSWKLQAQYLTQAFAIARKNPRIDMMLWFLLRDEPGRSGWQSGFFTASGVRKPAFAAFQRLPH